LKRLEVVNASLLESMRLMQEPDADTGPDGNVGPEGSGGNGNGNV